jgi:hypothetical protein
MVDPCVFGDLGRMKGCYKPVIIEPMDYLTMDTGLHFQVALVVVLAALIWTARRRWRRRSQNGLHH